MTRRADGKKGRFILALFATLFLLGFFLLNTIRFLSETKWDGKRRFTIIVNTTPFLIFSIEPKTQRAIVFLIPENTFAEVPYGYGDYPLSSVFRLGELDKKKGGGFLLSRAVEDTFGILVDGFISYQPDVNSNLLLNNLSEIREYKKKHFSLKSIPSILIRFFGQKHFMSNISLIDTMKLWYSIYNIRMDKITYINLKEEERYLNEEKLPDGSNFYKVDSDIFDFLLSSHFEDYDIRVENISVEVINASNKDKVATNMARILKNLGVNVLAKSTASDTLKDSCFVKLKDSKLRNSKIIDRLKRHYQCQIREDKILQDIDIEIIFGEDFIN
jgi:hypothetical protein